MLSCLTLQKVVMFCFAERSHVLLCIALSFRSEKLARQSVVTSYFAEGGHVLLCREKLCGLVVVKTKYFEIVSNITDLGLKNLDLRFRKLGFHEFPHKVFITELYRGIHD